MKEDARFIDEDGNELAFVSVPGAGYRLELNSERFTFSSSKEVKRVQRDQNAKIKAAEAD
jgi:hypothetical protein